MARIRKSEDTRARLIEIGMTTFAKHGYHGTGIKEIVDHAGVPKGSFYNYFKSKEEFGIEIVRCHSAEFWNNLNTCFDRKIENALEALGKCFMQMISEHEDCTVHNCSIVGNLAAELSEHSLLCRSTIQTIINDWQDNLAVHIRQAQLQGTARADVSATELAQLFWDSWHGSLIHVKIANSTEPLKRIVSFLLEKIITK